MSQDPDCARHGEDGEFSTRDPGTQAFKQIRMELSGEETPLTQARSSLEGGASVRRTTHMNSITTERSIVVAAVWATFFLVGTLF